MRAKRDLKGISGIEKLIEDAFAASVREMKDDLVSAGVMPYDSGRLQNEATYVDEADWKNRVLHIVSDTEYAARVYFHPEYQFDRTVNADAGGRWFDAYILGEKKGLLEEKMIRKLKGGK